MDEFELKNTSFETFILDSLARWASRKAPPHDCDKTVFHWQPNVPQGTKQDLDVPGASKYYYLHVHEAFWAETDQRWCPEMETNRCLWTRSII